MKPKINKTVINRDESLCLKPKFRSEIAMTQFAEEYKKTNPDFAKFCKVADAIMIDATKNGGTL